ncbi:hypothetical protein [Microtetraspora malaysiensis]|uniref:hypothetical protein n=1 Tax=Microtetraspora malaysiensis TaxID=161358 RepID=UPI003D8FAC03
MTLNIDLLKRTLEHIEATPEEWYQGAYRCGTGMCFAGWACTFAGGVWAGGPDEWDGEDLIADEGDGDDASFLYEDMNGNDVYGVSAGRRARRLLGLTPEQATDLFDGHNTLDDLRRIVAELCVEAGER